MYSWRHFSMISKRFKRILYNFAHWKLLSGNFVSQFCFWCRSRCRYWSCGAFFFWKAELSLTSFSVFFMPGSTVINDPLLFLLLNSIVLAHQVYLSVIVYVCIKCKRLCYKWKINVLKQHLQRPKLWTNLTAVLPQGITVVRKIVSKLFREVSSSHYL